VLIFGGGMAVLPMRKYRFVLHRTRFLFRFENARTRWDFNFQGGDVSRIVPGASAVSQLFIV